MLYPIAYPLSLGLDWWFGLDDESKRFTRNDLKTLMELHKDNKGIIFLFLNFRSEFDWKGNLNDYLDYRFKWYYSWKNNDSKWANFYVKSRWNN